MLPINFVDNPEDLGNIINRIEWIDLKIFIRMKQNASEISEAFQSLTQKTSIRSRFSK